MNVVIDREFITAVVIGHVDHGKSTIIGRLLAETGSLPEGKLEQVKGTCARNAKPFEYAFLLDALKDEQNQGITIDAARCFFKTEKRNYLLMDAPGHIEFLKNMITGASRAEAALLIIDAKEGIQENSRRHGYIASMLAIRQIAVIINKMDLVGYDEDRFNELKTEYTEFLSHIDLKPVNFIPVSATEGQNIASYSSETGWYNGPTVLDQLEAFQPLVPPVDFPFRFPLQDVYKFTENKDDRRILAGTIETGSINVGERVSLYPSGKTSTVKSIERFNSPQTDSGQAGEALGLTLDTQIYARAGELMVKSEDPPPEVGTRLRVNIFWMGRAPMIKNKTYKLKLGALRSRVFLAEVLSVLDASELNSINNKQQIDRHDLAECILECPKPIVFDLKSQVEQTGRLVIVDNYEIAGAGIILENVRDDESVLKKHFLERERHWGGSSIPPDTRANYYRHKPKFVVFTGRTDDESAARAEYLARKLEKELFERNFKAYYLGIGTVVRGLDSDLPPEENFPEDHVRRLGELARILTDSGQIFITSVPNLDDFDLQILELLNRPHDILVINVGEKTFRSYNIDLNILKEADEGSALMEACALLKKKEVILEYVI